MKISKQIHINLYIIYEYYLDYLDYYRIRNNCKDFTPPPQKFLICVDKLGYPYFKNNNYKYKVLHLYIWNKLK